MESGTHTRIALIKVIEGERALSGHGHANECDQLLLACRRLLASTVGLPADKSNRADATTRAPGFARRAPTQFGPITGT